MIFEQIRVGGDRNFAYLVGEEDSRHAAVIDPGMQPEKVLRYAATQGLTIVYVINTHNHFDHTSGNDLIIKKTGARLAGYGLRPGAAGVQHGDTLRIGALQLHVLHTPGHTPDSICILVENKLLTGDTLFVGKVGGTGYGRDARQQYESLHTKLMTLPEQVEVFPGHDYGDAPSSTIGHEKKTNPFILQDSFEAFVDLKKNWTE